MDEPEIPLVTLNEEAGHGQADALVFANDGLQRYEARAGATPRAGGAQVVSESGKGTLTSACPAWLVAMSAAQKSGIGNIFGPLVRPGVRA